MFLLQNITRPLKLRLLKRTIANAARVTTAYSTYRLQQPPQRQLLQRLPLQRPMCVWAYVAVAFNRVDNDRLMLVGADRLCAEWVLKNGGAVSFIGMGGKVFRDYNSLPPESVKFRIQIVLAIDASIMKIGFEHFNGCKHIDTVVLHNCKHLEEDGLEGLKYLADSLKRLQISGCYNLNDKSFDVLGKLNKLEHLRIFDLIYVKNMNEVIRDIQSKLPQCKIEHN